MECHPICPTKCGPGELQCWGGRDSNGCEREGTCMPIHQGNTDNNGNECPASCPVNCADDEIQCSGGSYPNGCPVPDICIAKQYTFGSDGSECPQNCPVTCAPSD